MFQICDEQLTLDKNKSIQIILKTKYPNEQFIRIFL